MPPSISRMGLRKEVFPLSRSAFRYPIRAYIYTSQDSTYIILKSSAKTWKEKNKRFEKRLWKLLFTTKRTAVLNTVLSLTFRGKLFEDSSCSTGSPAKVAPPPKFSKYKIASKLAQHFSKCQKLWRDPKPRKSPGWHSQRATLHATVPHIWLTVLLVTATVPLFWLPLSPSHLESAAVVYKHLQCNIHAPETVASMLLHLLHTCEQMYDELSSSLQCTL